MSYQIGAFGFVRWEGPRPQYTKQHLQTFTKTGQSGVSALGLGVHGDAFDITLSAVFPNETQARLSEVSYRGLIGLSPQTLIYEGVNYTTTYSTLYLVEDVMVESAKRHPRLIGITYDLIGGWLVKSRWRLRPIVN